MGDDEVREVVEGDGYAVGNVEALAEGPGFRKIRRALGVTAFGVNAIEIPPGFQTGRHFHEEQEELYFVHRGRIAITMNDETEHVLGPGGLARVDASTVRQIRNVGVSNVGVAEIERARAVVPIAAVQNRYSVSDRGHDDVVDYCAREGIVFVAYFPLRGTGAGALAEIAERRGATEAQVALAWLLKRSPAILPIPGSLSIVQVKENLAAQELALSDAELEALL